MSFHAYLKNIQDKTGKSPSDFQKLAEQRGYMENGLLKPTIKAGEIVEWLKKNYSLGHGHSMAIYALLKGKKE